jgi:hypothetical protein
VRAHDPFELIRWLALSQPDPRKALAELVQNSLDAGAHRIRVTRIRIKGVPCLRIFDDGEGVIPEMERAEALRYIATHIGHSRKRSLSPEERLTLMTQGQYGIGLLGFWSLGEMLEMRTSVPGQRSHRLVLHRDRPDFLIEPLRGRLPLDERWTEVVVVGLHKGAMQALVCRRAADYLGSELRGQLLARDVELIIEDRMSRGRAQKLIQVRPPRFLGERLEGIGPVEVPGHSPIRFEIYLAGDERAAGAAGGQHHGLSVYSSGTLVAEDFHALAALGLDRSPWNDPRLSGIVDFAAFRVAPGSRRGVVVDDAAEAFAQALTVIEPVIQGVLDRLEQRQAEELDRTLVRDLQRAFRDFYRQQPRYAMLPVKDSKDQGAGPDTAGASNPERGGKGPGTPGTTGADESVSEAAMATGLPAPEQVPPAQTAYLLPPGPLVSVRISPALVRVECGAERRVRAHALDASNRVIEDPVTYVWRLAGPVGALAPAAGIESAGEVTAIVEGEADREIVAAGRVESWDKVQTGNPVVVKAVSEPADGTLTAVARSGELEATAEAAVEVLDELISSSRSNEGIPQPEFVHQPGVAWRSRMIDGRWQVNSGHREYRAIDEQPTLKLRYLAMLFAKEVVLRSHQDPRLERPLEQLVEVAAYADRNLSLKRRGRRRTSRCSD